MSDKERRRAIERKSKGTFKARMKQRLRHSRCVSKRTGYASVVATYEDLVRVYNKQSGCCLLCGAFGGDKGQFLHLDHDHKTGNFRGFLCSSCNRGIGYLKDDPDLLERAAKFIRGPIDGEDLTG